MKENKIMKMISRRDFLKASAVVGATGVLTACGFFRFYCCFLYCSFYRCFFYRSCCFRLC